MKKKLYLLIMAICSLSMISSCGKNQVADEVEEEPPVAVDVYEIPKEDHFEQEKLEDGDYIDQFLNGEGKVVVDADWNLGAGSLKGKSFSLQEFIDTFSVDDLGEALDTTRDYSIIEREGVRYLLIRFTGMDIYYEDDGSFTIYVLVEKEDGLHATESVSTWARSYSSISNDGIISSSGSSGAGYHISDEQYLDKDGFAQLFYRGDACFAGWIGSLVEYYQYHQFSDEAIQLAYELDGLEGSSDGYIVLYNIDGDIYAYTENFDSELIDRFIVVTENEGVTWLSEGEIDKLYEKTLADHGFSNREELQWSPIS